jgi:hypothetical protein
MKSRGVTGEARRLVAEGPRKVPGVAHLDDPRLVRGEIVDLQEVADEIMVSRVQPVLEKV